VVRAHIYIGIKIHDKEADFDFPDAEILARPFTWGCRIVLIDGDKLATAEKVLKGNEIPRKKSRALLQRPANQPTLGEWENHKTHPTYIDSTAPAGECSKK
jgi:hypothetical protein